jgi:hypothetical protein
MTTVSMALFDLYTTNFGGVSVLSATLVRREKRITGSLL